MGAERDRGSDRDMDVGKDGSADIDDDCGGKDDGGTKDNDRRGETTNGTRDDERLALLH